MQRADRILFPSALLFAGLIGLCLPRRALQVLAAGPGQPAPATAPVAQEFEGTLTRFMAELGAYRAGDDARLAQLRELARALCDTWQRCDALDVTEYYARLDRPARLRGLEDEQRCLELRARVRAAERAELDEAAWQTEREEILAGLEALATSIPPLADRVPAAQATALAAHLRVEHLFRAQGLGDEERTQELDSLDRDLAQSEQIFVASGMLRPRIELDWISGLRARSEDRPEEARRRFTRCLEEARSLGDRGWQGRALQELHELAQAAGDLRRMLALIDELAALEAPELSWPVARRYAGMLVWNDQPERAQEFLRTHAPGAGSADSDEFTLLCGHCRLRGGDIAGALETYASIPGTSPRARDARLAEAAALLQRGSATQALALLESPEAALGRSAEARGIWLTLHAEILLALGHRAQALRELHETLDSAVTAQARLFEERGANPSTNVLGEVLGLHAVELLARAELEQGDALGAACTIESAQASTLRLAREGEAHAIGLARGDIAAWARHFELGLLTWVVGADETLVVLVSPDGSASGARIPHGRRALQEAVRRLRESVLAGDERRRERLGSELWAVLLPDALSQELLARAKDPSARLCCLLHGPLEALPIEALEDGAWLGNGFVSVVLPGLPAEAPRPDWQPADASRWRLLGDPTSAGGTRLLPGAKEELDGLARLLPGSAMATRAAFNGESFAAALGSGDCLHIATHVRHGDDDARFVLSGDAEYTLEQTRELRPHSNLVVLTGCETGGGRFADAEGLQGLARAFLDGGTRNLVATSWPVEDRSARAFALALHRALATGLTPSRACAQARRSLRAQGTPAAEWAAFRSIGQD